MEESSYWLIDWSIVFLGPRPRRMEVPRPGVELQLQLQLPAYSHSHGGSELHLQPTQQLMVTPDP